MTTNDAYLEPARERSNLRVIGGATVERVLIEAGRAAGVRVRVGRDWIEVRAERVVLCAGAIHSPAVLLRSGIGPDGPVVRLPVGHGMQEHTLALFWLFPRPDARPDVDARQANCLVRYSSQLEDAGSDDMMIASVNQTPALPDDAPSHLVMDRESGTWGGAGGDLRRMRDGVKRCLQLVATGAFDAAFQHIGIDPAGTGLEALSDDAAIDAWLMAMVGDTGHICGTCRMGAPSDLIRGMPAATGAATERVAA